MPKISYGWDGHWSGTGPATAVAGRTPRDFISLGVWTGKQDVLPSKQQASTGSRKSRCREERLLIGSKGCPGSKVVVLDVRFAGCYQLVR